MQRKDTREDMRKFCNGHLSERAQCGESISVSSSAQSGDFPLEHPVTHAKMTRLRVSQHKGPLLNEMGILVTLA